jgi:hypothetical protein
MGISLRTISSQTEHGSDGLLISLTSMGNTTTLRLHARGCVRKLPLPHSSHRTRINRAPGGRSKSGAWGRADRGADGGEVRDTDYVLIRWRASVVPHSRAEKSA